ncbi:hypothetical protein G6045_33430 [Streptomyces sp. YC504]|uniref:Uncharacterized protein n=1 Tax=Streptomyces mesophilus TaxID=1775132 RepID=A0A6G4XTI4_9ACTN|nr:hypothetical protein [Streptomyces mesophilus]
MPNQSAEDWTTYADHVVVVTATSEQELPPTSKEVAAGEGLINRTVRLKVDKVLWSNPNAATPAPKTWDFNALGWEFTDGNQDNRRLMAMADRPRVEVGHTYIMAMEWEPAECRGEGAATGAWMGLGEGSELPYDNKVIGKGEEEGRLQDPPNAARAGVTETAPAGLEEELAGATETALVSQLNEAAASPASSSVLGAQAGCS